MPGLFSRLTGRGKAVPPPFTLELPEGWAGGHGPTAYMEALLEYGRAHPDCHEQAMDRLRYPEDALYAAASACGPDSRLSVSAEDIPEGLPVANALNAFVEGNLEDLASRDDLLGAPTATSVDIPHGGRMLRWTWSYEGGEPTSLMLYVVPTDERLWEITFSSTPPSQAVEEVTFLAIVSSFRVSAEAS